MADLKHHQQQLAELLPKHELLLSMRRQLPWEARERLYDLEDQCDQHRRALSAARDELSKLPVIVVDEAAARLGFPTIVNGKPACFSWQSDEEGIHFWHFIGEARRRQIPARWWRAATLNLSRVK